MRGMIVAFGILMSVGAGSQTTPGACQNLDCILAAVPRPTLGVARAIEIAQQYVGTRDDYTLVGVDWSMASKFAPRYTDGSDWSIGNDQPNDYSWFLTYVATDPRRAAVRIIRIKPDGSQGTLISVRG